MFSPQAGSSCRFKGRQAQASHASLHMVLSVLTNGLSPRLIEVLHTIGHSEEKHLMRRRVIHNDLLGWMWHLRMALHIIGSAEVYTSKGALSPLPNQNTWACSTFPCAVQHCNNNVGPHGLTEPTSDQLTQPPHPIAASPSFPDGSEARLPCAPQPTHNTAADRGKVPAGIV